METPQEAGRTVASGMILVSDSNPYEVLYSGGIIVGTRDTDGDGTVNAKDDDSDNDNLTDGKEDDGDGVLEMENGETDPTDLDTDGDGLPDGWIDGWGYDETEEGHPDTLDYFGQYNTSNGVREAHEGEDRDFNGRKGSNETARNDTDTDDDELTDSEEFIWEHTYQQLGQQLGSGGTTGTNPKFPDSDDDGIKDGADWEPLVSDLKLAIKVYEVNAYYQETSFGTTPEPELFLQFRFDQYLEDSETWESCSQQTYRSDDYGEGYFSQKDMYHLFSAHLKLLKLDLFYLGQ